jgi:hypothetical protein
LNGRVMIMSRSAEGMPELDATGIGLRRLP